MPLEYSFLEAYRIFSLSPALWRFTKIFLDRCLFSLFWGRGTRNSSFYSVNIYKNCCWLSSSIFSILSFLNSLFWCCFYMTGSLIFLNFISYFPHLCFLFSLEDVTLFSNLSIEFLIFAIMLLILKNSDLDSNVLLKKPLFLNKFTGSFQNSTKWPHVPLTQFPSMIIFYVNIVQYEKQKFDICTTCVQFGAILSHV